MNDDVSYEAFRTIIGIVLGVVLLVAIGAIWLTSIAIGIGIVMALAVVAGALGHYVGSSPTAITSGSFVFLYLRTLAREFPVAIRNMVRPVLIVVGLWFVVSLGLFFSLVLSRYERTGQPDFSGFEGWMSDTVRFALVIFVIMAIYYHRQIITSVVTLLAGLDGKTETTIALGAREPTRSEHDDIIDSLSEIKGRGDGKMKTPKAWMVLDSPIQNHYVIGRTVYLTSALIESDYRTVGMLHALGHIAHGDGVILLSLRKFIRALPYYYGIDRRVMPPGVISGGRMSGGSGIQEVSRASDIELADRMQAVEYAEEFAKKYGGMGLLVYGLHWAEFWRERVFLADGFVQKVGYSQELIEYLKEYAFFDVAQPFLARGRPYTRERIDRLEG